MGTLLGKRRDRCGVLHCLRRSYGSVEALGDLRLSNESRIKIGVEGLRRGHSKSVRAVADVDAGGDAKVEGATRKRVSSAVGQGSSKAGTTGARAVRMAHFQRD